MNVGIDATTIQGPHRMRGIGSTLINFVNNLSELSKKNHQFVFFVYPEGGTEPSCLSLLNLEDVEYEIRIVNNTQKSDTIIKHLSERLRQTDRKHTGLFRLILGFAKTVVESATGDFRSYDTKGLDVFIQFDQQRPLPRKVKSILILYDIIPYVVESEYLITYTSARSAGLSIKASLAKKVTRVKYRLSIALNVRRAARLIAISQHTKNDFVSYFGVKESKIEVCYLGVSHRNDSQNLSSPPTHKYVGTAWGPMRRKMSKIELPYLLYIGGVDSRRRLVDLVAAYYNLRARGVEIELILAGDMMQGAKQIPVDKLRNYFSTSYEAEIRFLGFITDQERNWLYENALTFIYPSVYEGFGLPVLEAMSLGSPVITYKNTSIEEVAANSALYVNGRDGIVKAVLALIDNKELSQRYIASGKRHARKYSWQKFSDSILNE